MQHLNNYKIFNICLVNILLISCSSIPTTPLPSGAPNLDLIMETIRVETIVEYLLKDGSIVVAFPPGTVEIGIPGGARVVNTNFGSMKGYIR